MSEKTKYSSHYGREKGWEFREDFNDPGEWDYPWRFWADGKWVVFDNPVKDEEVLKIVEEGSFVGKHYPRLVGKKIPLKLFRGTTFDEDLGMVAQWEVGVYRANERMASAAKLNLPIGEWMGFRVVRSKK